MQGGGLSGERRRIGGIAEVFLPEPGVDISGADGVDADVPWRQFQGQVPGERDHARFRAGIRNGIRKGVAGMDGADVHDGSAGFREPWCDRLSQQEGAAEVDFEYSIPVLLGQLGEGLFCFNSRIVYENIQMFMRLSQGLNRLLDLKRLPQIGLQELNRQRGIFGGEFSGGLGSAFGIAIENEDTRALALEQRGHSPPDALSSAADQSDAICKPAGSTDWIHGRDITADIAPAACV